MSRASRVSRALDRVLGVLPRLALQAVVPAALIALWWFTSDGSDSLYYPPLREVLEDLDDEWLFDQVDSDLLPSLGRFGAGYLLAGVLGVAAGVGLGLAPWLQRATQPVTEFLRALPPPLLLPFALVTLGTGNMSRVVVIALGAVWPVLLNTVDGVRGTDPQALEMARSFGLSPAQRVVRVMLPAAGPRIMVGLRTALSIALILVIVSEMRAPTNGIGFRVLDAQRSFDTAGMFAGIIVIGLVGVALNTVLLAAERRTLRWYHGAQGLLQEA